MRSRSVDRRCPSPGDGGTINILGVTDLPLCQPTPFHQWLGWGLLAQVLERDLDAVIIELLVVGAELVAAARAAVEELTDNADGRVRLTLEECRAAYVDGAVQIQVVDISVGLADQQAWNRLVPDTQHLSTGADWGNVLITPADLVIETKARNRRTVRVELDAFGARQVVAQVFREGHFHSGNQIDDHAHLLALGRLCGNLEANGKGTREGDRLECL
jgi:hypothetical protein